MRATVSGTWTAARELLDAARSELDVLPDVGMFALLLDETEEHLSGRRRREGFLGEELSESELRVLRLLASGRSLREVAGELLPVAEHREVAPAHDLPQAGGAARARKRSSGRPSSTLVPSAESPG